MNNLLFNRAVESRNKYESPSELHICTSKKPAASTTDRQGSRFSDPVERPRRHNDEKRRRGVAAAAAGNRNGCITGNSRNSGKGIILRVSEERVSNYHWIVLHSVRRGWLAASKSNSFRTLSADLLRSRPSLFLPVGLSFRFSNPFHWVPLP